MIKGVKFASIPTRNQDAAVEFWTKRVGFRVQTDQPFNDEQRWIELGIPGAQTHIVLFAMEGQQPGGFSNVTFYADDVAKTAAEMKQKGVEFVQDPKTADWGTAAIFKDLEGNVFVLSSK
jgi:predicted enzyme related to lactoylglutathione lyase